jgi:plastocyanin
MKKVSIGILVAAFVVGSFTVTYFFSNNVAEAAAGKTVTLTNNMFGPKTVTIKKGQSVTWVAKEGAHTVKADNGAFQSGTLTAGKSYSYTFNTPGTYGYHCTFHGSPGHDMAGKVIVKK